MEAVNPHGDHCIVEMREDSGLTEGVVVKTEKRNAAKKLKNIRIKLVRLCSMHEIHFQEL